MQRFPGTLLVWDAHSFERLPYFAPVPGQSYDNFYWHGDYLDGHGDVDGALVGAYRWSAFPRLVGLQPHYYKGGALPPLSDSLTAGNVPFLPFADDDDWMFAFGWGDKVWLWHHDDSVTNTQLVQRVYCFQLNSARTKYDRYQDGDFGLRTGFKYIKWFQAVSETEVYILRFSGSGRDSYRVTLHYIDLDTNPTGSTGGVENGLKYWNLYQGGSQQFFWTYASGLDPFTGYLGYGGADTALDGGTDDNRRLIGWDLTSYAEFPDSWDMAPRYVWDKSLGSLLYYGGNPYGEVVLDSSDVNPLFAHYPMNCSGGLVVDQVSATQEITLDGSSRFRGYEARFLRPEDRNLYATPGSLLGVAPSSSRVRQYDFDGIDFLDFVAPSQLFLDEYSTGVLRRWPVVQIRRRGENGARVLCWDVQVAF